ncbi:MAG: hypothetical protein WCK33_13610, partial [Phycisphaerae bacterium]
ARPLVDDRSMQKGLHRSCPANAQTRVCASPCGTTCCRNSDRSMAGHGGSPPASIQMKIVASNRKLLQTRTIFDANVTIDLRPARG